MHGGSNRLQGSWAVAKGDDRQTAILWRIAGQLADELGEAGACVHVTATDTCPPGTVPNTIAWSHFGVESGTPWPWRCAECDNPLCPCCARHFGD